MPRGLFIVIEGADAVGKTEQQRRLVRKLRSNRYNVIKYDFPQYRMPDGALIGHILRSGVFPKEDVQSEWVAGFISALYGKDRALVKEDLCLYLNVAGAVVVSNRFTWTNIAHQVVKIQRGDPEVARRLIEYAEFEHYKLPRPDLNILLNVSAEVSRKLMIERAPADAHESDFAYQLKVRRYFLRLAAEDPACWSVINCENRNGSLLPPAEIHKMIWAAVQPRLQRRRPA